MKTNPTTEALGKESYQTHQFEKVSNEAEKNNQKEVELTRLQERRDWTTFKNYY